MCPDGRLVNCTGVLMRKICRDAILRPLQIAGNQSQHYPKLPCTGLPRNSPELDRRELSLEKTNVAQVASCSRARMGRHASDVTFCSFFCSEKSMPGQSSNQSHVSASSCMCAGWFVINIEQSLSHQEKRVQLEIFD